MKPCGRIFKCSALVLDYLRQIHYSAMPNVTVSSLKRENDSLKDEISAIKRNLSKLIKLVPQCKPLSAEFLKDPS